MYQVIEMAVFAEKNLTELSLIDVREQEEFAEGHIPQAVNLPLSGFPTAMEQLDMTRQHFLICRSGSRSAMLGDYLAEQGYDVVNIFGGMNAWRGAVV